MLAPANNNIQRHVTKKELAREWKKQKGKDYNPKHIKDRVRMNRLKEHMLIEFNPHIKNKAQLKAILKLEKRLQSVVVATGEKKEKKKAAEKVIEVFQELQQEHHDTLLELARVKSQLEVSKHITGTHIRWIGNVSPIAQEYVDAHRGEFLDCDLEADAKKDKWKQKGKPALLNFFETEGELWPKDRMERQRQEVQALDRYFAPGDAYMDKSAQVIHDWQQEQGIGTIETPPTTD